VSKDSRINVNFALISGAGDGNRTHVRSLGSSIWSEKTLELAAILRFSTFLKWIPIGAAFELAAVYLANHFQLESLTNKIVALGVAMIMVDW
jgi:hypothetical protein